MNIFYVYEHWRTDTNQCFYVGKGKNKRAYNLSNRNPKHKSIVKSVLRNGFAVEIKIVASGLSEDDAFILEVSRINFWKNDGANLANMTNGGEGTSGCIAPNRKKVLCLNDNILFNSLTDAATYYKINISEISAVCKGKKVSAKKYFFVFSNSLMEEKIRHDAMSGIKNTFILRRKKVDIPKSFGSAASGLDSKGRKSSGPQKISKPVICLDNNEVFASASEAARQFKLSKSAIIELCLGKNGRKTVGGLQFKYAGV